MIQCFKVPPGFKTTRVLGCNFKLIVVVYVKRGVLLRLKLLSASRVCVIRHRRSHESDVSSEDRGRVDQIVLHLAKKKHSSQQIKGKATLEDNE